MHGNPVARTVPNAITLRSSAGKSPTSAGSRPTTVFRPDLPLTAAAIEEAMGSGPTSASGSPLPSALYDQLSDAYRTLADLSQAQKLSVAVRSSALDEDGSGASFAGQHDTYLNVVGEEAVANAVARCWVSVRNPHAIQYRRQQGLPVDSLKIAVLVQQLVPADVSAVAFGANPVTGNRDEVVINASWGLGESVVGGR